MEEFLADASQQLRQDFFDAISLLTQGQSLSMPLSRNMSSIFTGLHELRLKDRAGPIRVFYYVKRYDGIYVLHAFKKKSQQTPQREIALVLKRIKEI